MYSWTEEEWEDLWQDIEIAVTADPPAADHYMGYLVLRTIKRDVFEVIDGQQRMATLSVLILAVLKNIQDLIAADVMKADNQKRYDLIRNSYIGFLDAVSLVTKSKLKLNNNNDSFYQNTLVPLNIMPRRGLNPSNKLLKQAYEWFQKRTKQYTESNSSEKNGEAYAKLVDEIANRLVFTVITVENELNAYIVFETLNARGVRLSAADLLKNYLFSVVGNPKNPETQTEEELNKLSERWETLGQKLLDEDFTSYLRSYWNGNYPLARKTELYKRIKEKITSRQDVFNLILNLEKNVEIYIALDNPHDEFWNSIHGAREYISILKLFGVSQVHPLLMVSYHRLNTSEFISILRVCTILTFRYSVIGGLNPSELERVYNKAANNLSNGNAPNLNGALNDIRPLYVEDEKFRADFSLTSFNTSQPKALKLARYVLGALEYKQIGQCLDDPLDKSISIEHVLPENPEAGWEAFADNTHAQMVYRLGNLALMERAANRGVGNKAFAEKLNSYQGSTYSHTTAIAENYSDWTPETIANRQQSLSRLAVSLWRIGQYDAPAG